MDGINSDSRFHFYSRVIYCVVIVFIIFTLISLVLSQTNRVYLDFDLTDYSYMWSYENGSIVDFDNMVNENTITIHKRTNGEEINNKSLCFYSKNVHFTISLDGEVIYDFHPDSPKLFGKAYGIFPHCITLPVLRRDGNLYITIENVYPDNPGYIQELSLCNSNRFIISKIQRSAFEFIFCIIIFVFGAVLFVIGIVGRYFGDKRFEIISMGSFAMIASLWIAAETQMVPILTGAPIAVHFADYLSLDLLVLPGLVFVAFVMGYKSTKLIPIAAFTTIALVVFSIISTLNDYRDYHQLLWLTHIHLAIIAVMIILLILKGIIKKTITKNLTIILTVALSIVITAGIIDIFRYAMHPETYSSISYFKLSLFLFVLLCGIYEFESISEMSRRGRYAEIMEEIAYQDGLTGLLNRKAFNKELEEAEKKGEKLTLIMMDMNYLKKVNDQMGHDAGDLYITSLANYLSQSFTHDESCFRIGGDEFFIIAYYPISDQRFKDSMSELQKRIALFNSENGGSVPLSTAYGCCEYNPEKDRIEDRLKVADKKMYNMKSEMKASMQIEL